MAGAAIISPLNASAVVTAVTGTGPSLVAGGAVVTPDGVGTGYVSEVSPFGQNTWPVNIDDGGVGNAYRSCY